MTTKGVEKEENRLFRHSLLFKNTTVIPLQSLPSVNKGTEYSLFIEEKEK